MTKIPLSSLRFAALFSLCLLPSYGALITYNNAIDFSRANPGLATETFSSSLVDPGSYASCGSPLLSSAASNCFPMGGLLPGVTYSSSDRNLFLYGQGAGNNLHLGVDQGNVSLDLTFANTSVVGFRIYMGLIPSDSDVSVFSTTGALLGNFPSLSTVAYILA